MKYTRSIEGQVCFLTLKFDIRVVCITITQHITKYEENLCIRCKLSKISRNFNNWQLLVHLAPNWIKTASQYLLTQTKINYFTYLIIFGPRWPIGQQQTSSSRVGPQFAPQHQLGRAPFSVKYRWKVPCHVSFGLPTLLRPAGLHRNACLGILWSGILRTGPNHLNRLTLNFSMMFSCPVLRLNSSSLTISNHLIFMNFLRQPISNLLTLSSISFRPFQNSHPYNSTKRTMLLNSFNFVRRDTPL